MVKARTKKGVWTRISYAEGDALDKLSTAYQSKVNEYRDDPCDETEKAMNEHFKTFKDAVKKIK